MAVDEKATRMSVSALLALLVAACLTVLGARHWQPQIAMEWALSLLALLLLARLSLLRLRSRMWHCRRCGRRERARARHAGAATYMVAVPTYNNAASIEDVVRRIRRAAPEVTLLVVDDGSTDGTGERAKRAIEKESAFASAEVMRHPTNAGKGAALKTALAYALDRGYSHLITLDGDSQHFPEDIPKLRASSQQVPTAVVVGARDLSAETVQASSRFGRGFSNFWLAVQTGKRLPDSQSGFRVYPVAPSLSLGTRARAFDFEVEVLTLAGRAGLPLVSVPIQVHYPPASERVSHFDKLWDNVRISWVNSRLLLCMPLWFLGWPARLSHEDPPAPIVRPWEGRSRGTALGHLVFFWVLRAVGRWPAYVLLFPVSFYFLFAARPAVRASCEFLERVCGPTGNLGVLWRTYKHFLVFSQTLLDKAIGQVWGGKAFDWVSEGGDKVIASVEPGKRGALFLSAHVGNYELGGALYSYGDIPINVVMVDTEAEAIRTVHERFAKEPFPLKIIVTNKSAFPSLQILSALRSGELVALAGDRVIDNHWVWCDFLGKKAPFPTGPFMMAAAAKVPVILTFGFKTGPKSYHFLAEEPRAVDLPRRGRAEALAKHARWYAQRLEHYARRYPYQWFNYYDFWAEPEASPETIDGKA